MKRSTVKLIHIIRLILFSIMIQQIIRNPGYGYESRTCIHAETTRDIINYSDEEASQIARIRLSENIDDTFIFNYSVLHDINNGKNDYTWNIGLNNIYNHFDFIAGNYNLRFGSGLIMGRKKFISSDSFSKSMIVSHDESIVPSTGTNPSASFSGTAVEIYTSGDEYSAGCIPFISSQKRYITSEELEQGYIKSSLSALSERTTGNSKYSEYANILNYGGMLWFSFIDYFTVQVYGFETELLAPGRNNLKWEYDTAKKSGIEGYKAGGIFIEYSDNVISFFIEPAFSLREYDAPVTGKAIMWGFGAKNSVALFSVRGKNCDPDFRSEYSSGDRNPENVFEIKTGIIPLKKLEFGALFFSEKNINPAYSSDCPGGTVREEFYSGIRPYRWIKLDFTAARVRNYSDDFEQEKIKVSSSVLLTLPWNFFFRMKSDIQRENSEKATVSACELKYLFFNNFIFSAGYTDIRAGNENGIYAAIIPAAEAEMCTSLYRDSAKGGAVKLRYKRENLSFHARGAVIETGGEREITAESSLGFIF
ncbi:MAG TPA: hypothetical protein PK293_03875 [Spirochaetota bacterium]|nr:hypothetical protein [Spirochaetota bacterium]